MLSNKNFLNKNPARHFSFISNFQVSFYHKIYMVPILIAEAQCNINLSSSISYFCGTYKQTEKKFHGWFKLNFILGLEKAANFTQDQTLFDFGGKKNNLKIKQNKIIYPMMILQLLKIMKWP